MIKGEHLSVTQNNHILFEDISFSLAQKGFVSFCGEKDACSYMAHLLSGLTYPKQGNLWFQNTPLNKETVSNGCIRTSFVQGLFDDFQCIGNRSVLYNVTLGFHYQQQDVEQLLREWKLDQKKHIAMEDLSFEDQARTILVRCFLRSTKMIVYDVDSSPFSMKERESLYQLLKIASKQILVVVCGDKEANKYSEQCIECEQGYIMSDSLPKEEKEHPILIRTFQMPMGKLKAIGKDMQQRSQWKYRALFLCLLIGAMAINIVLFNSQLHLVDLEESVLANRGQTAIQIEKQAIGDDGRIYSNYYEKLQEKDVGHLKKELQGNLVYSYEIENPTQELERIYGVAYDDNDLYQYKVVELQKPSQFGLKYIIGSYPKNYFEVCLPSYIARTLVSNGYFQGIENYEDVIGESIVWYGRVLKVTGIIPIDQNANATIQIQQVEENGRNAVTELYYDNLFVKEGFIENHDVSKQQTFPNVQKSLTYQGNTITIDQIRYPQVGGISYYDGERFLRDATLQEDEVYLDFYTVYHLIYYQRYRDVLVNDDMTLEEKQADYYNYAARLVNETLTLDTYRILGAQNNSTLLKKTFKVKGILTDGGHIFDQGFSPEANKGKIIMKEQTIQPYLKQNYQIDKVLYETNDRESMFDTLNYLKQHDYYKAFVSNSRMFQVFVVDIKDLSNVLLFIGIMFLVLYTIGFLYLVDRNRKFRQKEMTIYYLFGESKKKLAGIYQKHMSFTLLKYNVFAGIASLIVIYILIYFIYRDFMNAEMPMLTYILIPVVFMLGLWLMLSMFVWIFLKIQNILIECVHSKKV